MTSGYEEGLKYYKEAVEIYDILLTMPSVYASNYITFISQYLLFITQGSGISERMIYELQTKSEQLIKDYVKIDTDENKVFYASFLSNLGLMLTIIKQPNLALSYFTKSINIIKTMSNILTDDTISTLSLVYHRISRIYEGKEEFSLSCEKMLDAIRFMKMLYSTKKHEAKEMVAMFYIELASIRHVQKNHSNEYSCYREALGILSELHRENPNRSIKHILGSYQKLILTYLDKNHEEEIVLYTKDLIAFCELCKQQNPNMNELTSITTVAYYNLAMIEELFREDLNKAIEMYIKILNDLGLEEFSKEQSLSYLAVKRLNGLGVFKIKIDGKMCGIGFNPEM